MRAKTDDPRYVRDLTSGGLLAIDKKALMKHRNEVQKFNDLNLRKWPKTLNLGHFGTKMPILKPKHLFSKIRKRHFSRLTKG